MKKRIILTISIIAFAFSSCLKEEARLDTENLSVLKATVEATDMTRVGFSKNENDWSFYWHKDDNIWVNGDLMSTKAENGSKTAEFTGFGVNTENGYAVYPYNKAFEKVTDNKLTWNFPASYEPVSIDNNFFDTDQEVPMYAVVADGSASFKHLAAICAFKFNGWSYTGSHRFELHTSKKITGDFTVDLESETPVIVTETEFEDCVTVTYERPDDAGEGSVVFYVPVPTGTYDLTIKVYVDDQLKFYKSANNVNVKRKDIVSSEFGKSTIIGGDGELVTTADELKAALADEDIKTIVLAQDMTFSEILTIGRSVTIDGNGKKLTSTAGRAINVSGATDVTIKNMTINASGERGINVIQNTKKVTIQNVTVSAANYAINVAGSASEATIVVENSTLTGLNTVNIAGFDTTVTITDCTITCNDQTDVENYAAIAINPSTGDGSNVTVTGGTIIVYGDSYGGKLSTNSTLTFNGTTGNTTIINSVAKIDYSNNYFYTFSSLQDAIAHAKENETVELVDNVTLSEAIEINKNITLNLQDYTITLTQPTSGSTPTEIKNYGTLTLTGGKIIAEDDILTRRCIYNYGTMTINGTEFVQQYESKGAAINNASKMIITDATVKSKYFCIWNENANGDLTINGGTFNCNSYTEPDENNTDANNPTYSYAIRNTSSAKLTINNGEFNCTHGFASIEKGSATTIHGGNVKFTGELNQSAHTFYIFDETTKLTVDGGNVDWTNQNGSTLVYNVSGDSNNIVFTGGTFDITDCHNYSFPTL